MASHQRIGKLPPRYSFILNPHAGTRLSKCPRCEKLTHPRKFAFFIHIEGSGPMALGKTCKYCSRCELILMHQDELEAQLAHLFRQGTPKANGEKYLVLGTIERQVWQAGLEVGGTEIQEILNHMADFKNVYGLEFDPGGRRRASE